MTFPSGGCKTCKLRRIKCDEARPVCQRCIKSRRLCYGMGTGALSTVHIENTYASGHKKRPRGPRSTQVTETIRDFHRVPRHPDVDLKSAAFFHFMYYHVQPQDCLKKSIFDWIRPMLKSKPDSALLDLAIHSMALAIFARQHPPAAIEASSTYYQLLTTVRSSITSLDRESIDTYLLVVFLMSRYENAVHDPKSNHLHLKRCSTTSLQSFSHHDGALTLLKVWKDRSIHTEQPSEIVKYTRRGLIRSALLRKLAIAEWMRDGALFGEDGLDLEYDRIVVRLANIRQRLFAILQGQNDEEYRSPLVEPLVNEARQIDRALKQWTTHFPRAWGHCRHTLPASCLWSTKKCYSRTLYSYMNPSVALIWNIYYAMRALANSTLLRLLELTDPASALSVESRAECRRRINDMANDVAASLPFYLSRFEVEVTRSDPNSVLGQESITIKTDQDIKPYMAGQIAWPLGILSSLLDVGMKQRSWFRTELTHLGSMKADRVIEDGTPCSGLNF